MKKILETAKNKSDQAEVYYTRSSSGSMSMRDSKTTKMSTSIQSGYALRLLKGGKIGTAYTKSLKNIDEFVNNGCMSLKGNVEASFEFPEHIELLDADAYDPSVGKISYSDLQKEAQKLLKYLEGKIEGLVDIGVGYGTDETGIMNSRGLNMSQSSSFYYIYTSLLFPNTEAGICKMFLNREIEDFSRDEIDSLVEMYKAGLPEVDIPSGKMKVMFTVDSMYGLLWRLSAAAQGKSFYNRVSPLQDKLGQKVLSDKFTLYGDPSAPDNVGRRMFDDEGMPTKKHHVFEKGVFKNLILNLDYAAKLGMKPTGNGFRGGMWGGETVSLPPVPSLNSSRIAPGDTSFEKMVSSMDRGVIIFGMLGAHSGNILNGDLCVGLNPGYYVKDGKIRGRVKDGMVSGNVYELLNNVITVEDTLHDSLMGGKYPSILLDDVSVSAKK